MTELIVRELVLGKYVQLKHNKYQIVSTDYRDIFFFFYRRELLMSCRPIALAFEQIHMWTR